MEAERFMTESIPDPLPGKVSYPGKVSITGDTVKFRNGLLQSTSIAISDIKAITAKEVDSITFDEVIFTIWTDKEGIVFSEVQNGFSQLEMQLSSRLPGYESNWRVRLAGVDAGKELSIWKGRIAR